MLTKDDVEEICDLICPLCRDKVTLRYRDDTNEWVHDRKEVHGQSTTTFYHSYCQATKFRNSRFAKHG